MARRKHNPLTNDEKVAIGVFAVAGLGAGAWYYYNRYRLTLAPGNQSLAVPSGSSFTLQLPQGATWTSLAAGSLTGGVSASASTLAGNAPQTLQSQGQGQVVNATWTDSHGTVQNTTISITA